MDHHWSRQELYLPPPAQRILICINPLSMSIISESYISWPRSAVSRWLRSLTRSLPPPSKTNPNRLPMNATYKVTLLVSSWVRVEVRTTSRDKALTETLSMIQSGLLPLSDLEEVEYADIYLIPE